MNSLATKTASSSIITLLVAGALLWECSNIGFSQSFRLEACPLETPTTSYTVTTVPSSTEAWSSTMTNVSPTLITAHASSGFSTSYPSTPIVSRNWALEVANAKSNLKEDRFPSIDQARQRLDRAMVSLENFLATSPEHGANWLAFLSWEELKKELTRKIPSQEKLQQIEKAFRQNYFGLEMRQFTQVRDSLDAYLNALVFHDRAKSLEILGNRLTKLSEQLQTPGFQQDMEVSREIGQTLEYLAQANQATELVNSVKGQFAKSNFRVLVSNSFIQQKFSRPVNESNPVNEVILGTQIYGQSWFQGQVTPQLLDSATRAAFRLTLSGNFSSQSTGYNRSVKLYSQGSASLEACETLALAEEGLVSLNDTSADAVLSTQINDIEARLRLVRRIAAKKAAEQKPLADSIAEGRMENRVRNEFHQKIANQISEANGKLRVPEPPALSRLGLGIPSRTTWSSPNYLALLWKAQKGAQLAAPTSCPLIVEHSGFTVQIHESALSNLLEPVLAGRVIRSSDIDKLAGQFGNLASKNIAKQDKDDAWSITLESFHPVEVEFDQSKVTFRVRINKLEQNKQTPLRSISVEASYNVVLVDGAIQLTRDGEVKVDFGTKNKGTSAAGRRAVLKKKFEELFREQLLDQPARVNDRFPRELQGMSVQPVVIDQGWFQLHVK